MNIIQSFWSKPAFHDFQNYENARRFGGWPSYKYFLISSALSCLTLRKQNGSIELYTDSRGSEILINELNLPYDDVSLILNDLDDEDHRLWIRGKMTAIAMQRKPFLHVDNDVYVWSPFPKYIDEKYIVAQSQIPIWTEYKLSLHELLSTSRDVPECLKGRPDSRTLVANVGVIGGNDLDFFLELCETSATMLERNRRYLSQINVGGFNQMIEEYLFTAMARTKNYAVKYILPPNVSNEIPPYLRLNLVPFACKYIHLIGQYKMSLFACEQLECRLRQEFPREYKRVNEIIRDKYPALAGRDSIEPQRLVQLEKILSIMYSKDPGAVEKMKVRMTPGIEVIVANKYFADGNTQLLVKENHPVERYRFYPSPLLNQNDTWLQGLTGAKSVEELADEECSAETTHADREIIKAAFLDSVTRNLLLGIVEPVLN